MIEMLFIYIFVISYTGLKFTDANDINKSNLTLKNDGPAILDSTITFYASLSFESGKQKYKFVFEDNTRYRNKRIISGNQNVSLSLVYESDKYHEGHYFMKVTVYESEDMNKIIASEKSDFKLTENMVGEIMVYQEDMNEEDYYAVNKETNFTAVIHDPSGYFLNKHLTYSWDVNSIRFVNDKSVVYNFTKAGTYTVSAIIVAFGTNLSSNFRYKFKWGYFTKKITISEPIATINITGNLWLKHGDLLSINVACDGSGPSFEYCWEFVPSNETDSNLTCTNPVVTTTCSFVIIHYYSKVGSHFIKLFISNYISHLGKTIEVRIYDVNRQPQLSTVIIPIVCSVLTFVIIIMGVAYHIQQRKHYTIEVADFDFHQTEDLIERTFFERLRESFKIAMCRKKEEDDDKVQETGISNPLCD